MVKSSALHAARRRPPDIYFMFFQRAPAWLLRPPTCPTEFVCEATNSGQAHARRRSPPECPLAISRGVRLRLFGCSRAAKLFTLAARNARIFSAPTHSSRTLIRSEPYVVPTPKRSSCTPHPARNSCSFFPVGLAVFLLVLSCVLLVVFCFTMVVFYLKKDVFEIRAR